MKKEGDGAGGPYVDGVCPATHLARNELQLLGIEGSPLHPGVCYALECLDAGQMLRLETGPGTPSTDVVYPHGFPREGRKCERCPEDLATALSVRTVDLDKVHIIIRGSV
ncbi:MAG: hypothetical protein PWP76_610 [Candidatus Diapherotrites archaeon]|nr:hypothetical protein [Candidatus Diapherotrites archaeon]MDN5366892.1 hypothetical protein [Candidatus Diapherotrites archaeon]